MIEIGFHTDAFNSAYWSFEQCLQWAQRNDVHWIVTEHGAANLKGLSVSERARAVIGLAHPDFRDSLTAEARAQGLV